MFGFKAYFWNDKVHIGGETYRSNEILTACLNFEAKKFTGYLYDLEELRQRLMLQEDPGVDYCKEYNEYAQRAQGLLYRIEEAVQTLPPYRSLPVNATGAPKLFDCLNANYHYWENGTDSGGYWGAPEDEDFANEYGFYTRNDEGRVFFYCQVFEPELLMLENPNPDTVLTIHKTNMEIGALLDCYITMVRDLIHAQAYAELLDKHIHREDRFLREDEVAACFTGYRKSVEKKSKLERVSFSGSMQMSHEVYRTGDGQEHFCETYSFDSLGAFLYVDFFRGLNRCHLPKRCKNCGRYFLLTAGKYSNYCDRPLADDRTKTCKDVGARRKYDDKCKTDPVWKPYNRAYKAHYARYLKKKMTTAEFEQWSRYAVELRSQAEAGTLPLAEYEAILKK